MLRVLSFLGTFVLIALIDYITEGRMSRDTELVFQSLATV